MRRGTNGTATVIRVDAGCWYVELEGQMGMLLKKDLDAIRYNSSNLVVGSKVNVIFNNRFMTGIPVFEILEINVKSSFHNKYKKSSKEYSDKHNRPVVNLTGDKRIKIVEKIRKMLALAGNNPSQEEALSAALQAQRLMAKYNIHEEDVELEEIKDEIDSVMATQFYEPRSWYKQLSSLVAKNFRCKNYLRGKQVVFRGYREDAELAKEVYLMLYTVGDALGKEAYKTQFRETGSGRGAYDSVIAGFLDGIRDGFKGQCTELMIITPKEVEDEYKLYSANFGTYKTRRIRSRDAKLYQKGYDEGKSVVRGRTLKAN